VSDNRIVVAIIPCYNEGKYIGEVVKRCKSYVDIVLVVDNNSTDNTHQEALLAGAEYVLEPRPGVGNATARGIRYSLEEFKADIIVTLDGDSQHDPAEIPRLLNPILQSRADFVLGCRHYNRMPGYRRIGNSLINTVTNMFSRQWLCDTSSGFRAITRRVAESVQIRESGFGFATEYLIKARAMDYSIASVPVQCIYHSGFWENSTLNPVKHGLIVLYKTMKWRIRARVLGNS
jgi:glycosyltransferase involved in cell wall biosynthesis